MFHVGERVIIRVAPFGMDLILSSYALAAPLLLIELKASPIELGLVGSIISGVHMVLAHRIGRLSERFGRRRLLLLSPILFACSCLIAAMAKRVEVILLLSALNGLCLSLFWPAFQAWIADRQTDSGVARDIGTMNMAWTASMVVGPTLAGFLFGFHPKLPFIFSAGLSFILFLLGYGSIHDRSGAVRGRQSVGEAPSPTWQKNFLYASWIANFMSWFILGNARYQLPKLLRELGNSPQMVGLLIGCLGLFLFLGFFFLRESDLWHFRRRYLFGSQALASAGLVTIYLSRSPFLFALALAAIGLSGSVTYYSSLLYAIRLSAQKGRGTGFHESILSIGGLLGPILCGFAAQAFGLRIPYLTCLLFLFAAVACEAVLLMRKDEAV